ncbi:hypothetical protein M9X92_009120 [Pyricularia oryzae]|nr:hypothetical protein M9X92_009120 [Pyricularia oryzae]
MPVNYNRTNLQIMPRTKDRMREQWEKCHEAQEVLRQIEIQDVVSALGIDELQAAELQGCIFTLLATGPTSLCFAAERMVIRLAKERWPDLLCWDEIPSIWLTEAIHECVEHVKRGGNLVKEVRGSRGQLDAEQDSETASQPVSADKHVMDQQQEDMDLHDSIETSSATVSGNDQAGAFLNSLSKDSEQTAEEQNDNSGDEFEPMLGVDYTSNSHQDIQLQGDKPASVVVFTPTKQVIDQEPLISSAPTISGRDSRYHISPFDTSSPGLFVTPEREFMTNGSAAEVSMQGRSLDVDITASEGRDEELDQVNPKTETRLPPEGRHAKVILDCKFDKGLNRQMYLVRWAGQPETEDSWELIEHLTEDIELVVEYKKEQSTKQSYSLENGIADAGTARAHTVNRAPSPKTTSKVTPANHVLLRMLGKSSKGAREGKRPETISGAGKEIITSSQTPSAPPGDEDGPINNLFSPDAEVSLAQPETGPHGNETLAVDIINPAMPAPSSTSSQSHLLLANGPFTSRKTTLPTAVTKTPSPKSNDHGRSASPTPSGAPLHKPRLFAFPMFGPGWKKLGKTNQAHPQSSSPSPALADPRGAAPSGGDVEIGAGGRSNEAYDETSGSVRPASIDRVLRGSSDRKPQETTESGPFRHIKFAKPAKKTASGRNKTQLVEKSSRKQPSLLGTSSPSSLATVNETACQPATLTIKPGGARKITEYRANELPEKPQKAYPTTIHKMVKPVPTLQQTQQTPRRKVVNLKTGEVTYLDQPRKPDAQPSRAGNLVSTPPSTGTKLQAGLERRAAANSPAQWPSTPGTNQAGAKRKRGGDDLSLATHAAKRTNLYGP